MHERTSYSWLVKASPCATTPSDRSKRRNGGNSSAKDKMQEWYGKKTAKKREQGQPNQEGGRIGTEEPWGWPQNKKICRPCPRESQDFLSVQREKESWKCECGWTSPPRHAKSRSSCSSTPSCPCIKARPTFGSNCKCNHGTSSRCWHTKSRLRRTGQEDCSCSGKL